MEIWSSKWNQLRETVWEARDKKMDHFPLMDSLLPSLLLSIIYVLLSSVIAPLWFKNRKPFNLQKSLITFNFLMVFANAYLLQRMWIYAWGNNYEWFCEPLDSSNNSTSIKIAETVWLYYICKYIDWIDTLFFALRKKFNQISVLHLYHHAVMPINSWILARFIPGGGATFFVFLNAAVHVIMHSYYLLAALGPKFQKYLWWKKYLTLLQLVQFLVVLTHAFFALTIFDCDFELPAAVTYNFFVQVIIIFLLFVRFYIQTYNNSSHSHVKTKEN